MSNANNGPVVDEGDELKGQHNIKINAEGRTNTVSVGVNGKIEEFQTRKQITVSTAQLVALQNSGFDVEEIDAKDSSGDEAGADEGSSASAAGDRSKLKKDELVAQAKEAEIELDGTETKADLIAKLEAAEVKKDESGEAEKSAEQPASNVNNDGNTTGAAEGGEASAS